MRYPIYEPDVKRYTTSISKAIQDGWFSSQGEFIEKATCTAKSIIGTPYAVLVNNGTSATHLLYKSLRYKYPQLSTIYVPDFVFVAVWNAALYEYPTSMLHVLEMDPATLNMRVDEEYIRGLRPNSAVVVVHNVGNVVDVPRLQQIRPDIVFVEDACEAFLESYGDRRVGTASLCAAVSFFANKLVTTGEGGLFFTHDKDLYEFIYKTCHHGMTSTRYIYDVLGYNYRMTNLQAALLYDQLQDIERIQSIKQTVYNRYVQLFGDCVATAGLWMMVLRLPEIDVSRLSVFLASHGIDTRPMFYSIHCHAHLSGINAPNQTIGHSNLCMIPSSPSLTAWDQVFIWSTVEQYKRGLNVHLIRPTHDQLARFVSLGLPSTFRYFQSRSIAICDMHTLTMMLTNDENDPIGYAHIDDRWIGICIRDGYQSKGYGRFLMDCLLAYARINGIHPLRLSVDKTNERAIQMYIKAGFTLVRETETVLFMEESQ